MSIYVYRIFEAMGAGWIGQYVYACFFMYWINIFLSSQNMVIKEVSPQTGWSATSNNTDTLLYFCTIPANSGKYVMLSNI